MTIKDGYVLADTDGRIYRREDTYGVFRLTIVTVIPAS
jgi:hypothetical protein